MRRKDREQDTNFGLNVIDNTNFGVMTLKKNGYSLPLTFSRDENILYFHCAMQGQKVDYIEDGDLVRIVFVSQSETPREYTPQSMRDIIKNGGNTSGKIFTIEYKSAIVEGKIYNVEDEKEKIHSLKILCERLEPDMMEFFDHAIERSLKVTKVYKIEIDEIEAKAKEVVKM